MPWQTVSVMDNRTEFVTLASLKGANILELCRRFSISEKTGHKWLRRFRSGPGDPEALRDRSKRPLKSPGQTDPEMEKRVTELRREHPVWGGRKIRKVLETRGVTGLPAPSTITDILRRHGLISVAESQAHTPFKRFERAAPNELWQMDFKGHFETDSGCRCHPLTVLDDHSRYAVGLRACENEREETVRKELKDIFRRHGMPQAMLADNGSPWGSGGADRVTLLEVWLLTLGVKLYHGRPFHPQTQGKDERFHRTLKAEVLWQRFRDVAHCQTRFDLWRPEYNWVRPHEALGMEVPGKKYKMSSRSYPEKLPGPEYDRGMSVRKVSGLGDIGWLGRKYCVGKGFAGQWVGLRHDPQKEGTWEVLYYRHVVARLDSDGRLEQV